MKSLKPHMLQASIAVMGLVASAPALLAQDYTPEINSARQESRINTTFDLNRYLRDYDIDVRVSAGEATLSGIVDEDITKDLAEEIALSVDGINSVDNQIETQADYARNDADNDARTFADTVEDASITAAVKSKLLWSRHTDGLQTDVNTLNGMVTLSGTADSAEAKELANMLAENTAGVVSVDNQLRVMAGPARANADVNSAGDSATQAISDTWITTKVKSTFILSSNVRSRDISVTTENGVVSLSGAVQSGAERELAIALATNIRGVARVNSDGLDSPD